MNKAKFTEGQWFVVNTQDEITVTCGHADLCSVFTGNSDGHLIAAAPEMYQLLSDLNDDDAVECDYIDNLCRVLAKARGEQ